VSRKANGLVSFQKSLGLYKADIKMAKTYVPTLRLMTNEAKNYMARWQPIIETHLTAPQIEAFRSCLTCLIDLTALLGAEPIDE
jgi:hypothetical protein